MQEAFLNKNRIEILMLVSKLDVSKLPKTLGQTCLVHIPVKHRFISLIERSLLA